jgi:hypothetical protein
MKQINLKIKINPLNYNIEKYICNNINIKPPESYAKMNDDELNKIYNNVKKNFTNTELPYYFCKEIILSIRANIIRSHMILNHKKIILNNSNIINNYDNGINILELSKKYDASPLNLLRLIFKFKYKTKLTQLIKNNIILDNKDKEQIKIAIDNDIYALINQDIILKKSNNFELKIEKILDSKNIKYKTQNQLIDEQIKESNIITNTPDFLILDDLYINDIKINWIDAKNFYGLDSKFVKKKIEKQTKKYLEKWGSGSIIFNLGFGSKLNFNDILLIDFYSFEKIQII